MGESVIGLILGGLNTDGGHHKQWYLCEILKKLVGKKEYNEYKKEMDFEEGK